MLIGRMEKNQEKCFQIINYKLFSYKRTTKLNNVDSAVAY
jgi:hypothetical protein